jgi:exonuclease VII large subunit
MPAYKRIDIGFSKLVLSNEVKKNRKVKLLNLFNSIWLTAEIYNLFGYNNTISYFWVKDVNSNLWAVPNYLTARRYNVNLTLKF